MARPKKEKPLTEQQLEALQQKYLEDKNNEEVLHEYFLLLKTYARSILLKKIKGKFYLDPDKVDETATDAALKILDQYKKEGWGVWGSFFGALNWKVIEALYEYSSDDSSASLNAIIGKGEETHELGDILERIKATYIFKRGGEDPQVEFAREANEVRSEVYSVLNEARKVLTYRQLLLFKTYLLVRLRRPKTRWATALFKDFLTSKEEEAFEILLLEIRNRIHHTYVSTL